MLFSDFGDDFHEGAGAFFKGFEVVDFIVWLVVLPAAVEDALPFVGEAA